MKTKAISYAYPTSDAAEALGFRWSGCWFLRIGNRAVFGHVCAAQVAIEADRHPEPYDRFSYQFVRDGVFEHPNTALCESSLETACVA